MEQVIISLPESLNFSGFRSILFCVCSILSTIFFKSFFFGYYIVCLSIYASGRIPLWYLRFTPPVDYLFGILDLRL